MKKHIHYILGFSILALFQFAPINVETKLYSNIAHAQFGDPEEGDPDDDFDEGEDDDQYEADQVGNFILVIDDLAIALEDLCAQGESEFKKGAKRIKVALKALLKSVKYFKQIHADSVDAADWSEAKSLILDLIRVTQDPNSNFCEELDEDEDDEFDDEEEF